MKFKPGDKVIVRTERGELPAVYSCDGWKKDTGMVVIHGQPYVLPFKVIFPADTGEVDYVASGCLA